MATMKKPMAKKSAKKAAPMMAGPMMKAGGKMTKAQDGKKVIKGSRPKLGVFRTEKERTTRGGLLEPYKYSRQSLDTLGYSKGKPTYELKTEEGEGDKLRSKATSNKSKTILRKDVPSTLKSLNKAKNGKWIQKKKKK